jgi:hypothetical protein
MKTLFIIYQLIVRPCPFIWRCVGIQITQRFNGYQLLIEVHIQQLRCLLKRYKRENCSHPWWLCESKRSKSST